MPPMCRHRPQTAGRRRLRCPPGRLTSAPAGNRSSARVARAAAVEHTTPSGSAACPSGPNAARYSRRRDGGRSWPVRSRRQRSRLGQSHRRRRHPARLWKVTRSTLPTRCSRGMSRGGDGVPSSMAASVHGGGLDAEYRRQIYPCEECRRSRSGMRAEAHAHYEEQVRGPPPGSSAREATSSGCRRSLRGV
jgi:hypothetical protein